jgi:hypothetical protein
MKTIQSVFHSVLFLSLATAVPALPQSHPEDARVTGNVTGASGRGVGGVQVVAQQEGASDAQLWTATSVERDSFVFAA